MSAATVERPAARPSSGGGSRIRRVREATRLPEVVLAIVMAGCFVLLMWAGRGTTFFYDDWPYILDRQDWGPLALFAPHVDHLQVVSVFTYKVLFETVGLHHYEIYRGLLALLNVATGVLLYAYGRKRIGPWPSIGLAACLVVMAPSWYNLLFAFQINFVGACAAGVGTLLALDRNTRRWDIVAMVLLGVTIGSSSVGFPFVLGAAIEVLWRRDRWRRIWIVGVPLVLYGLWRLRYADGSSATADNLDDVPGWILNALDNGVAAIVGTSLSFGVVVAFALVALVAREYATPGRVTARLVALTLMPLSFWALTALGRANQGITADENRYQYVSGVLLALLAMEAARHYDLRGRVAAILTALLAFGAFTNAVGVDDGGERLREWSQTGKYAATAYDIAGHLKPPNFNQGDPTQGFIQVGVYLAATEKYGSTPGYTLDELAEAGPEHQRGVDEALQRVHEIGFAESDAEPAAGAAPPAVERSTRGVPEAGAAGCVRFVPNEPGGELDVPVPPAGLLVRGGDATTDLWLRRFSTIYSKEPRDSLAAGASATVTLQPDKAPQPWHARLRSDSPFEVCAVG